MVKSDTLPKGHLAEEALADYFRIGGFFAVRGVPFRHDGDDLTDIDVWLYERGSGLGRRRFIVDAKHKKSPKIVERLFWTCGLRDALRLDGAFVATTGVKEATRKLAKRVNITVLDLQTLGGSSGLSSLLDASRLSKDELDLMISNVGKQHASKDWRENYDDLLAALLTAFGGSGANIGLRSGFFYASQFLSAAPGSISNELSLRLFYLSAAAVAICLDYVAAQSAFLPPEARRREIEDTIRYGSDPSEMKSRVDLALDFVRAGLPNGTAIAAQLREQMRASSEARPADIIAEVVTKMAWKGHLFEAARILERAAYQRDLQGLKDLSIDAKSFASAILDFYEFDRSKFAGHFRSIASPNSMTDSEASPSEAGPLFKSKK